ncbi:MAG: type II toxin-antitoxin system prevent-host-death family antitoxin [Thermoleophilia bacterium]|nr:type II toxin-antitoxin system prevent-host-death family antitoxin [Thermoleophilia bacterium]
MTMKRRDYTRVQVAQLKARLSEHLRAAQSGETILVVSHDLPVALLTPPPDSSPALVIRQPRRDAMPLSKLGLPPPLDPPLDVDVVDLLLEERGER